MLDEIADYDKEMQTYYDTRQADKPLDSFSKQVVARLENTSEKRQKMVQYIKDQGFDLKLD